MWQVNGFGDGTTDKRLGGTHHADMSVCVNITLTFLSAFIGTVKNGQMFIFQSGRTFEHHRTAYIVVGGFDLFVGIAEGFQQTPFKIIILFGSKAQALQALFTQCILIENESNFKSSGGGSIETLDLVGDESFFAQALMVDKWRTGKAGGTHCILNDIICFFFRVP